jgi:LPS-assembly protein
MIILKKIQIRFWTKLFFLFSLLFLFSIPISSEEENSIPVIINHADEGEFIADRKNRIKEINLSGNIDISYKNIRITSSVMNIDVENKIIKATDKVILYQNEKKIEGENLIYNLNTEKGTFNNAACFVSPWYYKAPKIEKLPGKTLYLYNSKFTTCDLPNPHYWFSAKKIKIYLDKRFWAYNSMFFVKNIPLFYFPVYRRSLKKVPYGLVVTGGSDSIKGLEILSHYNWYINPQIRGRLYLDFLEKAGTGKGFDIHYREKKLPASKKSTAYLYVYFINEKDNLGEPDYPSYPNYKERWKLSYRHNQKIKDWLFIARGDKFSDSNFKENYEDEEIKKGWTQAELDDIQEKGNASLTRTFPRYILGISSKKRINDYSPVIAEETPRISLDMIKSKIGDTPYYYDLKTQFVRFHESPQGRTLNQQSTDLDLSRPTKIKWLNILPSLKYRQFFYSSDKISRNNILQGNWEGTLNLNAKLYKIFNLSNSKSIGKIRHIIQPSITYHFSPHPPYELSNLYEFAEKLPARKNFFDLELVNRLQTKTKNGLKKEWAKITLKNRYYLYPETNTDQPYKKWGDIKLDVDFYITERLSLFTETNFDPYLHEIEKSDLDISYKKDKFSIFAGLKYYLPQGVRDTFDLETGFKYKPNSKWGIELYNRHDLNFDYSQKWSIILKRNLHCWDVSLSIDRERREGSKDELKFYIMFSLKALPKIGLFKGDADIER